ncbi:MAG: hypothetical protein E7200_03100 [Selenomonas ruminantium]|nr:hypothetical protein [Selenomonas ruminantium]
MEEKIIKLSFGRLKIAVRPVGADYLLLITGGREHLGCTVMAEPRPSLTGAGISATSSVLNASGHKDEFICRPLAEKLSAQKNARVICAGGFHIDNISPAQLKELSEALEQVVWN